MKRQYRNLRDDTKQRIAQKLRGRSFSDSMKAYWATIPYRPTENNESKDKQSNEEDMQKECSD